ncbi:unnamed protein product, partial [Iphiclides podalirius]
MKRGGAAGRPGQSASRPAPAARVPSVESLAHRAQCRACVVPRRIAPCRAAPRRVAPCRESGALLNAASEHATGYTVARSQVGHQHTTL